MEIPFVGGSYTQRSTNLNAQASINCFPVIDNKESKNVIALYGTPGLKPFVYTVGYGPGTDGAVTISSNTTLTRDMFYTTLTINCGVTLDTHGYVISCSVALVNNGTITDSYSGGDGGIGGSGYNDGGPGGAPKKSGAGYGGNGGAGLGTTGKGPNGGKGGGVVRIYAKSFDNGGTIKANGSNAEITTWGGGADGGNGGTVSIHYDTLVNTGTVTATGGTHSDGASPYEDSYPGLLLHGNGTDGSTNIIDSKTTPKTVNVHGDVVIDTSYKVLGSGSIYLPTDSDDNYLAVADSDDFYLNGSYTIEAYFKPVSSILTSNARIFGLCGQYVNTGNYWWFGVALRKTSGVVYACPFFCFVYNNSYISYFYATNYTAINTDVFTHYAISHDASHRHWYMHIGGVNLALSGTVNVNFYNLAAALNVCSATGVEGVGVVTKYNTVGWIDEFNLSKGVCRYTASNFVPPIGEFTTVTNGSNGTAGTTVLIHMPINSISGSIRGRCVYNDILYAVIGSTVISIEPSGTMLTYGDLSTSSGFVSMDCNGTQVLIVDGTTDTRYIDIGAGTLKSVTTVAANSCVFMDGFFIITEVNTQNFYISALYDASSWDPLDYAVVEGSPDKLLRCFRVSQNLWLFGADSIEVYYNSGAADFPFQRIPGALIEDGLAGQEAVCLVKDQLYFLSNKREVVRNNGYQREKISTVHIDLEIQSYSTVSDAKAFEYRIDGHIFFVLTFPTVGKTWVYDVTTDYWHEWSSYVTAGAVIPTYSRHRGICSFFLGGKWYVGDYANSNIYELSMTTYTDNGELIPRTRRAQYINKERLNVIHHEIEIDFETGVGIGGEISAGSDPVVYLRWSDDGANTWTSYKSRRLGQSSEYVRVRWLRLGKSRNRVYEVKMTEPVKFVMLAAYERLEVCKA